MLSRKWLLGVPVGALLIFSLAQAQDAQPGQGQGQGRGRRGFGGDPAQRMNNIKERTGATEDEWKVLQPKIEKVTTAQREVMRGMFGGRGGPRGDRGGDRGGDQAQPRPNDQPDSKVVKARAELNTTLQNKSASKDDIQAKLKAYREAREKAQTDLKAAQKELKEVCSVRQEAALVLENVLE
jgi:hypothetical protein